uniref:Uncharacterized protein LOC100179199 n=1 Tax=Phallusia mammillata TaxID=59560 RepID=A0A6F9DGA3_9ASCI|nr:uncharacterized protein LOC100179199 [Phallusia mammillata]
MAITCDLQMRQMLRFGGILLQAFCCIASQTNILENNGHESSSSGLSLLTEPTQNKLDFLGEESINIFDTERRSSTPKFPQRLHNEAEQRLKRSTEQNVRGDRRKNRRKQKSSDKHTPIKVEQEEKPQNIIEYYKESIKQKPPNVCPMWPRDSRLIVNCTNGRHLGSKCFVRCQPGYQLTGKKKSYRRCRATKRIRQTKNGQAVRRLSWTGRDQSFQCVSICPPLVAPPNGEIKCKPSVGDPVSSVNTQQCMTRCRPGYVLSHNSVRRCRSNGSWSGQPATCQVFNLRTAIGPQFVRHQKLACGDVTSLTTYSYKGVTYLVAGDMESNIVRVFKWSGSRFSSLPWQTINHKDPKSVQVVPNKNGNLRLVVANGRGIALYRMNQSGHFQLSNLLPPPESADPKSLDTLVGLDFLSLHGEVLRCTNKRKGQRSIVLVQKLISTKGRPKFKRLARRKMRQREEIADCAMLPVDKTMLIIMTSNRPDGRGRILVGRPKQQRIRIAEVLKHADLRNISDISGFRTDHDGSTYLAAGQRVNGGHCFIYKRMSETEGS